MSDFSYGGSIPIARLSFNHANRPFVSPARHLDRTATRQMDKSKRLDTVRAKLRTHCNRHKGAWIGKEKFKLLNKYVQPRLNHPAPIGAARQATPMQQLARQARQNVEARITKRLSHLNTLRPENARSAPQTARNTKSLTQQFAIKR